MFDAIIGWLMAAGAGALVVWGTLWRLRAVRAKRQIDDYQLSSDRYQAEAKRRVEEAKTQAAGKAPIDPKARKDFE